MTVTDDIIARVEFLERENSELRSRLAEFVRRDTELLSAAEDTGDISFHDLFNIEEIQAIQDAFAEAVGISSLITAPDGTPITKPSNFCRLCSGIIRKTDRGIENCRRSDSVIGVYRPDGPTIQPCLSSGLYDAGASIRAGSRHVANWLMGQVRTEEQHEEEMLRYASEIGVDAKTYSEALKEVPVMSLEKFTRIANALYMFANLLSEIAMQNLQNKKDIYRLTGLLPICASCKKIRDDKGYWNRIETYIEKHSTAVFSHSLCPGCVKKLYGSEDWFKDDKQ